MAAAACPPLNLSIQHATQVSFATVSDADRQRIAAGYAFTLFPCPRTWQTGSIRRISEDAANDDNKRNAALGKRRGKCTGKYQVSVVVSDDSSADLKRFH